jgi:hypothetical protein
VKITKSTVERLAAEVERRTGNRPVESIGQPGDGRTHYIMSESATGVTYYGARAAAAYLLGILRGAGPDGSVHHVDTAWVQQIDDALTFAPVPSRQAFFTGTERGYALRKAAAEHAAS